MGVFRKLLLLLPVLAAATASSPSALHALHNSAPPTPEALANSQRARQALDAATDIAQQFGLSTPSEVQAALEREGLTERQSVTCPATVACTATKYRSVDGSCNNLKHSTWGQSSTTFRRMVAASYSDGVSAPRLSTASSALPSPRALTTSVFTTGSSTTPRWTLMLMQWGQFLAHDISATPTSRDVGACCSADGKHLTDLPSECLPISISQSDAFFGTYGVECIAMTRSLPATDASCQAAPRQQMNSLSAYIDANNVYGVSEDEANNLRTFVGGKLKVTEKTGDNLLPLNADASTGCPVPAVEEEAMCFRAGDGRVNEQPDLAVMHTIWMRQHNKVAGQLSTLNQGWDDETLYQEARRIIIAQNQHITYNEYLPIVLGKRYMDNLASKVQPSAQMSERLLEEPSDQMENVERRRGRGHGGRGKGGHGGKGGKGGKGGNGGGGKGGKGGGGSNDSEYREDVDAGLFNAFSTAAFRFGHSQVPHNLTGYSPSGKLDQDLEMSKVQFAPSMLHNANTFDSLVRGLAKQPYEQEKYMFTSEIVNRLFAGNRTHGLDLPAFNIQRGRDHGLAPYTAWRQACNLRVPTTFSELEGIVDPDSEALAELPNHYGNVDDIDLYVGAMIEKKEEGVNVGPTFQCIMGAQYANLKYGDRFWYEFAGQPSSFQESQLREIKRTTLARVICDNSIGITEMQPRAFVGPDSRDNRPVSCSDRRELPQLNLRPWRDHRHSG